MERRQFLTAVATAVAAAASARAVTAAEPATAGSPAAPPPHTHGTDGTLVLQEGAPLVIEGSVNLGNVTLKGGSIVSHGGGVINIARLSKE